MSDPQLEPLPPEIVALLAREEAGYPEDAALQKAVLAKIELTIGLATPGGGGEGGPGAGSAGDAGGLGHGGPAAAALTSGARALIGVAIGSFVAGGLVGGVIVNRTTNSPMPTPTTNPPASAIAPAGVPSLAASVMLPEVPSSTWTEVTPSARPSASRVKDLRGDLTRERELLDVARASLARGSTGDAIAAAERHATTWPHGYLAEEREVVWIQALVAGGRRDQAERRASRFRESFPSSVLLPAVDKALAQGTEKKSTP